MPSDSGSVDVLLVEDNPTDAELCLRALRKSNFTNRVIWAKDGAEALEVMFGSRTETETAPHRDLRVILLDLRLPKVDGFEVLRTLKSDARTKAIPVVVVTTSKDDNDLSRSYKLGANSYVSKPVAFEEFVQAMSQLGMYWLQVNQSLYQP